MKQVLPPAPVSDSITAEKKKITAFTVRLATIAVRADTITFEKSHGPSLASLMPFVPYEFLSLIIRR